MAPTTRSQTARVPVVTNVTKTKPSTDVLKTRVRDLMEKLEVSLRANKVANATIAQMRAEIEQLREEACASPQADSQDLELKLVYAMQLVKRFSEHIAQTRDTHENLVQELKRQHEEAAKLRETLASADIDRTCLAERIHLLERENVRLAEQQGQREADRTPVSEQEVAQTVASADVMAANFLTGEISLDEMFVQFRINGLLRPGNA
jgi:septal ring factor EnvC (AmiA/AmiB activator)